MERRDPASPRPPSVVVRGQQSAKLCPYCRDDLTPADPSLACRGCGTTYHYDCAAELARCGTLGCRAPLAAERTRQTRGPESRRSTLYRDAGHAPRRVHVCTGCRDDVHATHAVNCPSCLLPYHMGCAEDAGRCTSRSCEAPLPVVKAGWPRVVLGIVACWALALTPAVIAVHSSSPTSTVLGTLIKAAYLPPLLALGVFYGSRHVRQSTVRRVGEVLASLCALAAAIGLAIAGLFMEHGMLAGTLALGSVVALVSAAAVFVDLRRAR